MNKNNVLTASLMILIGSLIFLFYVLLYFWPITMPLKLSIGFSFAVILISVIILKGTYFLPTYKKSGIFIIILVLVSLIFYPVLPYSYSKIVGNEEIHNTVNNLEFGSQNPKEKLKRIMEWENKHLDDLYKKSPITWGIPLIWYESKDPSQIFYYKIANCEGQAILFTEMAEAFECIEKTRVVHNPAEDHNWAEVLIENSWIQVDPTRVENIEPSSYEEERNVEVSYVFVYENSKIKSVTEQYSDVGTLVVEVTEDDTPLENAEIEVKSKFLMNNNEDYKSPRSIVLYEKKTFLTNAEGRYQFTLGGNEYEVVAKKSEKTITKSVTVKENRTTRVKLNF